MRITKRLAGNGQWRVLVDGRPTPLMIVKGDPPHWGHVQMWWVYDHNTSQKEARPLFEVKGLHMAMAAIERIAFVVSPTPLPGGHRDVP